MSMYYYYTIYLIKQIIFIIKKIYAKKIYQTRNLPQKKEEINRI